MDSLGRENGHWGNMVGYWGFEHYFVKQVEACSFIE